MGTAAPFGLLLRAATRNAAPDVMDQPGIESSEIEVSAIAGPARMRLVQTVPAGSKVIWTSPAGKMQDTRIVHELSVDQDAKKFLSIVQVPAGSKGRPATEIFHECEGQFVSQGKVE